MNTPRNEPYLEITVQPIDQFRFRYETEKGSHGTLTGKEQGAFPTVCLHNFSGKATIRCSLYQMRKPDETPLPHSHSLIVRYDKVNKKDPHELTVSQDDGYQAIFKGMTIMKRKTKKTAQIVNELLEKLVEKSEFECGHALTPEQKDQLRAEAKTHAKKMDMNRVVLCFEAYAWINGQLGRLCEPVFSTPINDKKCTACGELKICRINTIVGCATGREDLFMFVKKVDKNNISVRFYEQNDSGDVIWDRWGTAVYVHYQYGIALKTPPYRSTNIKENVKVFIQLFRPTDSATSEPIEFRYKPCDDMDGNRKRPRISPPCYDSDVSGVVEQNAHSHHVQQHHDRISGIEQVYMDLPELMAVDYDTKNIMEGINQMISTWKKWNEDNMLAKDSVSDDVAAADGENSQELQKEVEKIVFKFLEIPLLLSCNSNEQQFYIGRKLCAYIFERVISNDDDTIVHLCVKSSDRTLMVRFVEILHKFRLDELLNSQNYNQETCLHLACATDNAKILQKMMEYGANVNVLDLNGNTALHIAIENGNDDCVSVLLNTDPMDAMHQEVDIDLSVFNDFGYTPLHLASTKNNLNVVEMLHQKATQKHCLSIFDDMDGKHGNNALHIAIQSNAHNVAEYLIVNKCISPSKMNRSGYTALYLARNANAMHLVNLMKRYTPANEECFMHDDNDCDDSDYDASSEEEEEKEEEEVSFKSQDTKTETSIEKLTKSAGETFDDKCYTELSEIFNKNDKWKLIADELGYQNHIDNWQKSRNPTKVLLIFAEKLKVSKDKVLKIFHEIGEKRAIQCIYEWNLR